MRNAESMKIVYAGIPCTFYYITSEIGNYKFGIYGALVNWEYLIIPDGLYELRSFNKEFMGQLSDMGINRHSIRFSLQETTGKVLVHFQKKGNTTYRMTLGYYNNDLLGFDLPGGVHIILPKKDENPVVGDKPINF
jgi:hypothetical protein